MSDETPRSDATTHAAGGQRPPLVRLCPDGPMLVVGDAEVEWEDGSRHRTVRPVSAICRCGATARAPWCDGTHKLLRR